MARICGILKQAFREDDPGGRIRLTAEDVKGTDVLPGLYSCSQEAIRKFGPIVIARLKKTPALGGDGKPVVDAHGRPVMVLPPDATLESINPSLLC